MHLTSSPDRPAWDPRRTPRTRLSRYAAIALGALVLFGVLLALVEGGWSPLARLDHGWTSALHDFARQHTAWTASLETTTMLGGPLVMRTLLALAAAWLWAIGARTMAGWTAAQALVGWGVEAAAKALVGRARPSWPDPVAHAAGAAFPSGHAMASAITAATLVALIWPRADRATRIACCALAALSSATVGFTRIGLGVHWPSDVLGGWFLAGAVLGGTTVAVELWRPGALSRDVRRVDWRTRPRVQSVLAPVVPFPELAPGEGYRYQDRLGRTFGGEFDDRFETRAPDGS
ncbi:phosphatase PAP2 family protein [Kitasatospora sp. GAS204B]|uniref:phosphatase PAP2 family protein n=1 Tax=unclassified Kitasatospora TaxID=2633591 RepID=UPI002473F127|nr:phosphatase PAP2 family protein [Kitasatospora sp. GAS204B]MDH6118002.1 membrane-associated phospholipid phosphatase [Kitasatospora sp. GAS204B]